MGHADQSGVCVSMQVTAMAPAQAGAARHSAAGFTLIEVMIVVAIIGILSAIAYPSYQQYIIRSNRTEGMALLNDAAARQERFFAQNNSYVTTQASIDKLGLPYTSGVGDATTVGSPTGKYLLQVSTAAGDGGYTLTAAPQTADTKCGNLTLNGTGTKGENGTADVDECWR